MSRGRRSGSARAGQVKDIFVIAHAAAVTAAVDGEAGLAVAGDRRGRCLGTHVVHGAGCGGSVNRSDAGFATGRWRCDGGGCNCGW